MQLRDLLDPERLVAEIAAGNISDRRHPEFHELAIFNYTDQAAWSGAWNHETLTCRGLIANLETGEVLARPFAKFFNYGQQEDVQYDLDAPILGAWDKADGSLGIGYERPDRVFALATRGSFESEQAIQGTEFLHEAYGKGSWFGTPLFEIVYPSNRIVLDYHGFAGLIYLGRVSIGTGRYEPPADMRFYTEGPPWPVRYAEKLPAKTLREALELPNRENAEGLVAWLDETTAVKIKQDDYVALHKIVTGLTKKEVWRQIRDETFDEFALKLPDEFFDWATQAANDIFSDAFTITTAARGRYYEVRRMTLGSYPEGNPLSKEQRKAFAIEASKDAYKSYLFALLDGQDIWPTALAAVEPRGE